MSDSPISTGSADWIERREASWLSRHWPEIVGAAVALVFASFCLNVVPGPDVAWQLWSAHQIRMGARLYVDIVETNPPLWFWEALPIDWASELLHIPSHVLLVAVTGCLAALSVWSTGRLIKAIPARWRAMLLVYAALTLLLMPLVDTGQKEQLMLIGALPYAALAAARRKGQAVAPLFAIAIAAAAAFGFALKHYFLAVPFFLELWLLAAQRRAYRPFRPETITLAVLAILYAALVVTITPTFFTTMLPINRLAYASVENTTFSDMFRPIQAYWLIALAPLLVEFGAFRRSPLAVAMMVSTLGFGLAWLIQFRGFPYHSIPVSGCLMMALACLVVENGRMMRPATLVAMPTIILLPLGFTVWYGPFPDDFRPISRAMMTGVGPRESVAFVNYQAVFSWPLSLYRDAPYPSRQYSMWILGAVARDRGRTPALTQLGREVVEQTTQDYRCAQPVRIIFSRMSAGGRDVKSWFDASPAFVDLMSHYRHFGSYLRGPGDVTFDIYQLKARFPKPPASACRRSY